jgi:ABC-type hemin transport system ATPase subunit
MVRRQPLTKAVAPSSRLVPDSRDPTARDRDIVAAAIEVLGMTAFRGRAYPTLSGGEQQKVQL